MSDEELSALDAHWMLGRLGVLQATIEHLATAEGLTDASRRELLDRSRLVGAQMQESLEATARGLPPTLVEHPDDRLPVSQE